MVLANKENLEKLASLIEKYSGNEYKQYFFIEEIAQADDVYEIYYRVRSADGMDYFYYGGYSLYRVSEREELKEVVDELKLKFNLPAYRYGVCWVEFDGE